VNFVPPFRIAAALYIEIRDFVLLRIPMCSPRQFSSSSSLEYQDLITQAVLI
jgi:hypothetical protein